MKLLWQIVACILLFGCKEPERPENSIAIQSFEGDFSQHSPLDDIWKAMEDDQDFHEYCILEYLAAPKKTDGRVVIKLDESFYNFAKYIQMNEPNLKGKYKEEAILRNAILLTKENSDTSYVDLSRIRF